MIKQDYVFACLAAILRLPAFFLLEKWLQSSEGEVWSQKHVAVTGMSLSIKYFVTLIKKKRKNIIVIIFFIEFFIYLK